MKKDKQTEVDSENMDQKNQKKKIKLSTMAPALSTLLVVACAGASVAAYTPKVYAVQKPEVKTTDTDDAAEETAEETALEGQVFDLPDGVYEGTGTGFAGKITVAVEIKDKKIVAITILNVEADDAAFFNRAKAVIDRIIQAQNLDVDVVSGATYSSRGIISAVKNALTGEKDSGKTAENPGQGQGSTTVAAVADAAAYKDGTYYGSATGFAGPIKVKVVISGGKIASVEIVETSDGSSYIGKASAITGKIVASQSTNVDTVSGATYSSVGIINAVRNALAQAAVDGSSVPASTESTEQNNQQSQTPAVPEVSGNFPYPDEDEDFEAYNLTAVITVKGDKITNITDITGDGASSNKSYIKKATTDSSSRVGMVTKITGLGAADLTEANLEGTMSKLDTVSGATCTSVSVKEACKEALAQARAKFLEQKKDEERLADVKMPDGTDETGKTDTELTDPEEGQKEVSEESEAEDGKKESEAETDPTDDSQGTEQEQLPVTEAE